MCEFIVETIYLEPDLFEVYQQLKYTWVNYSCGCGSDKYIYKHAILNNKPCKVIYENNKCYKIILYEKNF